MKLYFKCLFLVLACQALPLNSAPDELPEEQTGVTDTFLKTEMSAKMNQNDDNDDDSSIGQINDDEPRESAGRIDKVPMFIHLTADEVNDMHAEKNFDFSQNVYVNLNSARNFKSITQLVALLILTLM